MTAITAYSRLATVPRSPMGHAGSLVSAGRMVATSRLVRVGGRGLQS